MGQQACMVGWGEGAGFLSRPPCVGPAPILAACTHHPLLLTAPPRHFQDLRAFERWQLQDFCSRQGLDAGGSRMELEERIVNAMAIGKRVAVQRPCPEWQSRGPGPRPGCIAALRHRPRL